MPLARKLVGLRAREALDTVAVQRSKAARLIRKTLASAVANVEKNAKRSASDFTVDELAIETGPTMRRYWSRSRGMARPVRKRTSHIRVELWDGKDDED
jgi:large subunit ribosomal protein L22